MTIIIDSNIVFSSLLSTNSYQASLLLDNSFNFIAPSYLFVEIFKHKERLSKYSRLSADELLELLNLLVSNIEFVSDKLLSLSSRQRAYELCKDIDEKDTVFIALTLEFNALLWTGDKKLIEGLKNKGFDRFYYATK